MIVRQSTLPEDFLVISPEREPRSREIAGEIEQRRQGEWQQSCQVVASRAVPERKASGMCSRGTGAGEWLGCAAWTAAFLTILALASMAHVKVPTASAPLPLTLTGASLSENRLFLQVASPSPHLPVVTNFVLRRHSLRLPAKLTHVQPLCT